MWIFPALLAVLVFWRACRLAARIEEEKRFEHRHRFARVDQRHQHPDF